MKSVRLLIAVVTLTSVWACAPTDPEVARWEGRADQVEIIRDQWGVPHIYADTDANAVFGLMYAQAEDDFPRIERNFLFSQGREAEADGEDRIWRDLRMRLFIDPAEMQALYAESPQWLKDLMDGWADGLNYFLHTHPEVQPLALDRFEPWMALSFSEGSIGGDIERVNVNRLRDFYGEPEAAMEMVARVSAGDGMARADILAALPDPDAPLQMASALVTPDPYLEPRGSNGIAVAPSRTASGNAMLLINPHTSFYFREEAHVVSEEGLNAYGALTWGQFFVYQGFNENAGWMHTSSSVDNIDEFAEVIVEQEDGLYYRYGDELRPVEEKEVTIRYRTPEGGMGERTFTTYRTHHGPIVRAADGRWVAVALMEEPLRALIQSYSRTKASNLDEYLEVMDAHTNSSNNTLFADSEGNVAYLHSNFVPERDTSFDYDRPVDGSNPATDWTGVHDIDESPNSINPGSGWAYCTNNWPYSASGEGFSPSPSDFPRYMDRGSENPRGLHAIMLLEDAEGLTLEGLRDLAYDSYLTAFEPLVPALVRDFNAMAAGASGRAEIEEAVRLLEDWDLRWGVESVPTAVAVFWITELQRSTGDAARAAGMDGYAYMESRAARTARLDALGAALERLEREFGDWRTPWGEINRFQRLSGDIDLAYDDDQPSTPVGFTSARWGSLASFGAGPREGTNRWYGSSGNSFVAVVEFGERVRAMAVTAGGLSNQPDSPHFDDQIERYATGDLRPVNFYREDVEANAEAVYRPGRR